jgi:membrane-bound metal-dependent hydrolase YbcI (DUF457 family)
MDPVTHVLSAALWTEPVLRRRPGPSPVPLWRARAAVALGALLPDADGLVGWVSLSLYAKYHRVITHSLVCLPLLIGLAALIARHWPVRWLLPSLRPPADAPDVRPRWQPLLGLAAVGAVWHLVEDAVTGWGIWPLWPFSAIDLGLGQVNSLELPLLLLTLVAAALQYWLLDRGRARAAWSTAAIWLLLATAYTLLRAPLLGAPYA